MNELTRLFLTFAKIGAFSIGGGFVMIPLIRREVVEHYKWIDDKEFLDILAISQSAPGILAINISIFIGDRIKGKIGSLVAALGTALPSFIIILIIAGFATEFKDNPVVENIFKGIRPAVAALIAVPMLGMIKTSELNRYAYLIPIASVVLIVTLKISPMWIILAGAIMGIAYYKLVKR